MPITGTGAFNVTGGTVHVSGTNAFEPTNMVITGGTLDLDNTPAATNNVDAFMLSGSGTLTGDSPFTVNDAFDWSGGTLGGAGIFTLASSERRGRSRTPSCWPVTCSTKAAWSGTPDRSS